MLKLLFIVAWRNFSRDKLTSFIQLTGLIIGICCFILIQHYVEFQNSYNTQFTQAKDIYRVNLIRGENRPQTLTPLRLSKELTSNFPQISDATRISAGSVSVKQQQSVYSERALFVDTNHFEFFDFELIEGDYLTALDAPDSLVLHEDLAIKYFSRSTGVIGNRLTINSQEYQVTGVIKRQTTPNTLPQTILLPMKSFYSLLASQAWVELWNFNATVTFAKIDDPKAVSNLTETVSDYYDERAKGLSSFNSNRVSIEPFLDIYLNNSASRPLIPAGSRIMVTVFTIIALMILVLACVNFTNLATAAAMRRGKDVGVRKALGASKLQLITQYLLEAIMLTAIATLLAVVLAQLAMPAFNQLLNVAITLEFDWQLLIQLTGLTLIVGFIAGSYPAFYLSNLSAALVLKGMVNSSKSGIALRQSLIVLQFAIAAFLLVASLIVNWQMQYIENMPQGYERENIVVVSRGADIYNSFKSQAERHPDVMSVTMSHTVPTKATRTSNTVRKIDDISNEIWVGNNPVSYDYFSTYGIKILAGRDFSKAFANDAYKENEETPSLSTGKIIINETLASSLGWTAQQSVGKMVSLGNINDGLHDHQILAVVEDSHYTNVKNAVPPMTYVLSAEPQDLSLRWMSIRFRANSSSQSLSDMEQIWLSLDGNQAFKYDWTEDLFSASYRNENQQTQLLNIFSLLAIVVTAIGLFGLAAFNTQRRVKEIAVRKILGASTTELCFMLVNQFSKLVIIANLVALPIAYWLMRDWLNNFLYRIDMPTAAFLLSATFSLLIAYITVSVIAYRAATTKPVESLSCE